MTPIEKELDDLRREFDRRSIERLVAIRDLLEFLERERDNRGQLERLHLHFHAFAGMGGTFDRPKATSLGENAAMRAAELLRDGIGPADGDLAAWRDIVDELTGYFTAQGR